MNDGGEFREVEGGATILCFSVREWGRLRGLQAGPPTVLIQRGAVLTPAACANHYERTSDDVSFRIPDPE